MSGVAERFLTGCQEGKWMRQQVPPCLKTSAVSLPFFSALLRRPQWRRELRRWRSLMMGMAVGIRAICAFLALRVASASDEISDSSEYPPSLYNAEIDSDEQDSSFSARGLKYIATPFLDSFYSGQSLNNLNSPLPVFFNHQRGFYDSPDNPSDATRPLSYSASTCFHPDQKAVGYCTSPTDCLSSSFSRDRRSEWGEHSGTLMRIFGIGVPHYYPSCLYQTSFGHVTRGICCTEAQVSEVSLNEGSSVSKDISDVGNIPTEVGTAEINTDTVIAYRVGSNGPETGALDRSHVFARPDMPSKGEQTVVPVKEKSKKPKKKWWSFGQWGSTAKDEDHDEEKEDEHYPSQGTHVTHPPLLTHPTWPTHPPLPTHPSEHTNKPWWTTTPRYGQQTTTTRPSWEMQTTTRRPSWEVKPTTPKSTTRRPSWEVKPTTPKSTTYPTTTRRPFWWERVTTRKPPTQPPSWQETTARPWYPWTQWTTAPTTTRTTTTTKPRTTTTMEPLTAVAGSQGVCSPRYFRDHTIDEPLYQDPLGRITGGGPAAPHSFPWMALLFQNNKHVCGGSLIDDVHILTAAHCVASMSEWQIAGMRVVLGVHNVHSQESSRQDHRIKTVVRHKEYSRQLLYNDVAILTLEHHVKFTEHVRPICLYSGTDNFVEDWATVAGWGSLYEGGKQWDTPRKVSLKIWSNQECRDIYGRTAPGGIVESFICAGEQGRDACSGDSGGPIVKQINGVWMQIGVVSWGIGCGKGHYPGVYSRMTSFLPWIRKVQEKY